MNKELFDKCVEIAAKAISEKGHTGINAESQVQNIFAYELTDQKFATVTSSDVNSRQAVELRAQIKYVCELGLDTAKGKKLVYVKTRGLNIGTREKKNWITMPDIQESYHALIHLLIKSKLVKNINVLHTYANYSIDYSGDINEIPRVKAWETPPSSRGDYTGCFVVITFADGEVQTSYHHLQDILDTHQHFSKSSDTWSAHLQAMTAKSAILDATRYIPKLDTVVGDVVAHYDEGMEYGDTITEEQAMRLESSINDLGGDHKKFLSVLGALSYASIKSEKYQQAKRIIEEMNNA